MIHVALLDDDNNFLKIVREKIELELRNSDKITIFSDSEKFLAEVKNGTSFDVLISDIEMPKINGIQLGKLCNDLCPDMYLIFLTSFEQYAVESYMVNAYQYIMKRDIETRLPVILRKLLGQIRKEQNKYRMIGTPTNKETVYYRNIIYIFKDKGSKYVNYVTSNEVYKERITISQVLEELESEEFILVERGYIININHIASMSKNNIYMDNGDKIVSSRAHFKNVKEQINIYRGRMQ